MTASAIVIGGWTIRGSNGAGTTSLLVTIGPGKTIGPYCHWLFTNIGGYSGSVPGSQSYSTAEITDDGGAAVVNASSVIVDQVGMSTGSAYKEGTILAPLTTNTDQGYERKPGGVSGSGQDTDNNATDFAVTAPSDPQWHQSPCITAPTATESESWGAVKSLYR